MKKVIPEVAESPISIDTINLSAPLATGRSHEPERPDPVSNVFTVVANVDTEALLCHASENLASLSVMASDLADQLDGPRRNVALAMQQLTVLCELLVNRALDDLDPPQEVPGVSSSNQR
ncbi:MULTISPECIES: DUF6124 family protein [Pseudomonas]|uniref:DUF6124 family protein n=1 Tax=Pseudomonas TaxID=286 RepID=UPI001BE7A5A3|nr:MULTISPECIES: DUF6124 family protein [Pseudomonas]MBT2338219.1 hypothetical protein [Pseudomonas fluorescens]MCD4528327.1 DUF6124 family protein [Pseudomonas sp. C3-2018]